MRMKTASYRVQEPYRKVTALVWRDGCFSGQNASPRILKEGFGDVDSGKGWFVVRNEGGVAKGEQFDLILGFIAGGFGRAP